MEWNNRKTLWHEAVRSALNFPFFTNVSQNCFVFDVVNFNFFRKSCRNSSQPAARPWALADQAAVRMKLNQGVRDALNLASRVRRLERLEEAERTEAFLKLCFHPSKIQPLPPTRPGDLQAPAGLVPSHQGGPLLGGAPGDLGGGELANHQRRRSVPAISEEETFWLSIFKVHDGEAGPAQEVLVQETETDEEYSTDLVDLDELKLRFADPERVFHAIPFVSKKFVSSSTVRSP